MTKKKHKWLVLISTGIMIMLVNIDMTITNLSLAKICFFFNAGLNQTQWVMSSYLLATALSFIIFGRMADYLGKKRIFLLGVFLFSTASLIAGTTNELITLIIARFIQGLGYAATLGLSILLIIKAFPKKHKGFAIGSAITISGLSQGIGPILGGIILEYLNWNWIFLINVPLGFLSFIMTLIVVPGDSIEFNIKSFPFSILNLLLFISSFGIILFSINQAATLGLKYFLIMLIAGSILFFSFIKNCKKNFRSIIDLELFSNHTFKQVILLRFIFMIMFSSLLLIIPLYLQNILNLNSVSSGLFFLSMTIFIGILSPITGKILDRKGFIDPLIASFFFALLGITFMFFFNEKSSFILICVSLIFLGMAVGIHTPSSIDACLYEIPKEKSGAAIGLFYTAAITGAALGVGFSGLLMSVMSGYFFRITLNKLLVILPPEVIDGLLKVASGTKNISKNTSSYENIFFKYQNVAYKSFIYALRIELFTLLILIFIAFILAKKMRVN